MKDSLSVWEIYSRFLLGRNEHNWYLIYDPSVFTVLLKGRDCIIWIKEKTFFGYRAKPNTLADPMVD